MGIEDATPADVSNGEQFRKRSREKVAETSSESDLRDFSAGLQSALEDRDLPRARTLLADAEAVLVAHGSSTQPPRPQVAQAKAVFAASRARIAITAGDPIAARAILVQAIERWPEAPQLRGLMAEVMMANGRAKDARTVLHHLTNTEQAEGFDATPTPSSSTNEAG